MKKSKEKNTMSIKADEKLRMFRSFLALMIAAVIVVSSMFTVVAAVQSSDNSEVKGNSAGNLFIKSENEILGGDIIIAKNSNFSHSFDVISAKKITIKNGNNINTVALARGTVADALEKADINLAYNQAVSPSLSTNIVSDMTVTISEGTEIKLTADGETKIMYLTKGSVAEALTNADIELGKYDILNVSKNAEIYNGMNIIIQRVTYKDKTKTEKIKYDTIFENSDSIELGETKTKTKGKDGKKEIVTSCKYIDGKMVSEKVKSTTVTQKPVDKVVVVGTKGSSLDYVAGTFTDYNGAEIPYSRVISGSGTAYTAPAGAGTATGVSAYHGGVAVNPNIIPYGSKLYVVSTDGSVVYGYCTAVDTGGALMEGSAIVDCFYNTYDECVSFGRRDVNVYIVG